MRIALLSYRSKEHCGGQGVYVRHLSRGLVELGHEVEVFSRPALPRGPRPAGPAHQGARASTCSASPTRSARPALREFRSLADVLEYATDGHRLLRRAAGLQPARRARSCAARAGDFDVVHDNQSLGYGLLAHAAPRHPARRHGPPPDQPRPRGRARRRADAAQEARRCAGGTGSCRCRRGSPAASRCVLAVSGRLGRRHRRRLRARPRPDPGRAARRRHRAVRPRRRRGCPAASSRSPAPTSPLKGVVHLLEAVAKLRTEHDVELQLVVARSSRAAPTERRIAELGIERRRARASAASPTRTLADAARLGRGHVRARRSTRASRCRPSRRCRAAPPSSPAAPARCPRSSATPARAPCWSSRATPRPSPPRSRDCSSRPAERARLGAAGRGPRARALQLDLGRPATVEATPRPSPRPRRVTSRPTTRPICRSRWRTARADR